MSQNASTRWEQFYQEEARLAAIPPSECARQAVEVFAAYNARLILDVGCGTGRDAVLLAAGGARVVGADLAHSGLVLAKKRMDGIPNRPRLVGSDARYLPFGDGQFDGVYCFGMLHEFVGETAAENVDQTVRELYRVLKPAGVAVIATLAGEPEKGLPEVQFFNEAMFDAATVRFRRLFKMVYDDLGCTGRPDYKVWQGHFVKA